MDNVISVHCVGTVWAVLQSSCLLLQTNNMNSSECTTDSHFRYTVSTEKYWWQLLMVLVFFCSSSRCYQKTMSHSSVNFSFHNGLHLSMLEGLKDAIRHPHFVCIRLNIKFNTNNFSTCIFLLYGLMSVNYSFAPWWGILFYICYTSYEIGFSVSCNSSYHN